MLHYVFNEHCNFLIAWMISPSNRQLSDIHPILLYDAIQHPRLFSFHHLQTTKYFKNPINHFKQCASIKINVTMYKHIWIISSLNVCNLHRHKRNLVAHNRPFFVYPLPLNPVYAWEEVIYIWSRHLFESYIDAQYNLKSVPILK